MSSRYSSESRRVELILLSAILVFAFAAVALFQAISHLPAIIAYFSMPTHRAFGFALSVLVALALFACRLLVRALYGATELAFGCVVLWDSLSTVSSSGAGRWPIVVAAVYLLVRGFDNLYEGVRAPFKKKVEAEAKPNQAD